MKIKINKLAKSTRIYRKLHKTVAIVLVVFILIVSITGLLLAWKSELNLKPSSENIVKNNRSLVSLNTIQNNAILYIDSLQLSTTINRIDYRPIKGIAKVRFEKHFTELQIDCYTGKVISAKQRTSDIIEMIHDGSILDHLLNKNAIKQLYSTTISIGLLFISISGIVLWLNPKKIKKIKTSENKTT